MGIQENKALAQRPHEEIFNQGKLDLVDQVFAPDFTFHIPGVPPDLPRSRAGFRQFVMVLRSAFPDVYLSLEDSITEGDRVVNRWVFHGTHKGEFAGFPPSGKQVSLTGIDIWRISDGKIVELWQELDFFGLLQQIGMMAERSAAS